MDESSQKAARQKIIPTAPVPDKGNAVDGSIPSDSNNNSSVFWLKLTIISIIALNLLFAFYALKSDRFVTQTNSPESELIETDQSTPSQNKPNLPEFNSNKTDLESPAKEL